MPRTHKRVHKVSPLAGQNRPDKNNQTAMADEIGMGRSRVNNWQTRGLCCDPAELYIESVE